MYLDAGDDGDDDEPEPEEDVDLLVDNVEGQDAQRVKLLHGSGRTELVELALGHLNNQTVVFFGAFKTRVADPA